MKSPICTNLRIFIAEDEPIILMLLEDVLIELDCLVLGSANTVRESLLFLSKNEVDVAVLDGKLLDGQVDPVMDLLRGLGTPFILASGLASTALPSSIQGGLTLQKPYTVAQLRDALAACMALRPQAAG